MFIFDFILFWQSSMVRRGWVGEKEQVMEFKHKNLTGNFHLL
jgi:hypothetical protein